MSQLYPTYSMSILWNMDARTATTAALAFGELSEIPLDGDGVPRAHYRAMLTADKWRTLPDGRIARLVNNHHEIDRPNR